MTSETSSTLTGPLSISAKGVGYFNTEPDKGRDGTTWEVQKEFLNHAFPGDTVEVRKRPEMLYGKPQAEVIRIVSRAKTEFVGTIDRDPKGVNPAVFLIPDDRRMYTDIAVSPDSATDVQRGMKVLVKVNDWSDGAEHPTGEVVEIIGKAGENDTEMRAIALEKGFRDSFPAHVEAEAHQIKERESRPEEISKNIYLRRDMREPLTFTIDPIDAKDFDDALSIREITPHVALSSSEGQNDQRRFEIGVHIADVSHFVTPGTALDTEARKRALSVYLVDRTIPMLPEILSNDLCSLNPNTDKYTFSAVFEIDIHGKIYSKWFGKTVIHSDKRFTYEDAQEILDRGNGLYIEELTTLRTIAKIFEKQKFDNGAIDFEADEVKFKLDENGKPLSVYRKERKDIHRLIEEFMLLANREVAEYIYKAVETSNKKNGTKGQSVYRIHDAPDQDRINDLATFVKALGYELKNDKGKVTARDISNLLHQVEGKPEEELIKVATLRSMAKAIYSTKNIGHFGLGFAYYTHFTSPIRRYPDLMVHRLLERELTGGKIEQDELATFEKICQECSEREKQAANAERDSINTNRWSTCKTMSAKLSTASFPALPIGASI